MPVTITESRLEFAFPEVHPDARLFITVHRTLRVPDDDTTEQLTGVDDAALRIQVTPLKGETWDRRRAARQARQRTVADCGETMAPMAAPDGAIAAPGSAMGMGAGGSITQSVAVPIEPKENWAIGAHAHATLRIINSMQWQTLTGSPPHHAPPTITDYRRHGYPWFEWYEWYDDSLARHGSSKFADLDTVKQVGDKHGEQPLPDNPSFPPPTPHVVGG
ncbi:hypothetical protein VX037_09360 [Gordonia sp. Z-3]|jgi:hypothetical protein|uniref:hypothetical protein n=1 Tax=Gordonia sp. Z-3 TaxID=3115408 RepID=UPI002E2C668D|nr:hypothetical protein [Gordonia sp. Z-3]MED5801230.1 hypothetical protein [Gordonia sp. Z-3]